MLTAEVDKKENYLALRSLQALRDTDIASI